MNSNKFFGYHLILDCRECKLSRIEDKKTLIKFINELVKKIDMKKLGKTIIERVDDSSLGIKGNSVVQIIEKSSITCHFMENTLDAYIDIFSCKEFNIDTVIKCINKYFKPENINKMYLIRDAKI